MLGFAMAPSYIRVAAPITNNETKVMRSLKRCNAETRPHETSVVCANTRNLARECRIRVTFVRWGSRNRSRRCRVLGGE